MQNETEDNNIICAEKELETIKLLGLLSVESKEDLKLVFNFKLHEYDKGLSVG